jgi:hypothetical protein
MATDGNATAKSSRIPQFSLRAVLIWMAMLGVYLAILRWAASNAEHGYRPGVYYPFRPLPDFIAQPLSTGLSRSILSLGIGSGLIVIPLYSLIAMFVLVAIVVKIPHRPYSIDLFFASLLGLFCIESDVGLLATLLTSLVALAETAVRRLSRWHMVGSVSALLTSLGLYVAAFTIEGINSI